MAPDWWKFETHQFKYPTLYVREHNSSKLFERLIASIQQNFVMNEMTEYVEHKRIDTNLFVTFFCSIYTAEEIYAVQSVLVRESKLLRQNKRSDVFINMNLYDISFECHNNRNSTKMTRQLFHIHIPSVEEVSQ